MCDFPPAVINEQLVNLSLDAAFSSLPELVSALYKTRKMRSFPGKKIQEEPVRSHLYVTVMTSLLRLKPHVVWLVQA